MFKKVLVPLDGSDVAEAVLPYVSALTRGLNVPLVLLTVLDPAAVEVPVPARPGPRDKPEFWMAGPFMVTKPSAESGGPYRYQLEEMAQEKAEAALKMVSERPTMEGIEVDVVASFGSAAEEIVQVADREGCDLIAMSTHGRATLGRAVLGSVTDKVIHSSNVPVLAITPERARVYWTDGVAMSKIMVPLDGSELAETVLPYVEELAQALSLEVILVRAVKLGGFHGGFYGPQPYDPYIAHGVLEAELEQSAVEYLEGAAAGLRAKGLNVHWRLLKGPHAQDIVESARETPQDIIALTTHGRSGFTRWWLGSVAETLVRASGDPVLVIPPKKVSGS